MEKKKILVVLGAKKKERCITRTERKKKKEVGLNRLGVLNKKNRKKTRTAPRSEEVGVMQRSFLEKKIKNKKDGKIYESSNTRNLFLFFFFFFWEELVCGPTDNKDPLDMLFFF